MFDLYLDPDTHDLVIESNGNIKTIIENEGDVVVGTNQRLKVKLLTFFSEWLLDRTVGIKYFEEVLIKEYDQDSIDDMFKTIILNEPNVLSIDSYSSSVDPSTRKFSITAKVVESTTNTIIPIQIEI